MKKKPHDFSQEYATNSDPVHVSTVLFKDNNNIYIISMFPGKVPKSQRWRNDTKGKDHVEIS
jgi:hypothetical protein